MSVCFLWLDWKKKKCVTMAVLLRFVWSLIMGLLFTTITCCYYIYIYIYTKSGSWWSLLCVANSIMIELEFYYCLIKFKAPIVFVWLLGSSTSCCQISDLGVWTKTDWCFDLLIKSNSHGGDAIGCKAILFIPPKKEKKKREAETPTFRFTLPQLLSVCLA